ncbi:hypothetical protein [Ideonella sp. A 288]|nr:hypothetical protein [Ideonella sp. A 288]
MPPVPLRAIAHWPVVVAALASGLLEWTALTRRRVADRWQRRARRQLH